MIVINCKNANLIRNEKFILLSDIERTFFLFANLLVVRVYYNRNSVMHLSAKHTPVAIIAESVCYKKPRWRKKYCVVL